MPSEFEIKIAILCTYGIVAGGFAAIIFLVHWRKKRQLWRKTQERLAKKHEWDVAQGKARIAREKQAREDAELQRLQNQQAQKAARAANEQLAAQKEAERAAKEAELLPRANDAICILKETSNFTLLQKCLNTGASYLSETVLHRLFTENRAIIIDAAVIMAGATNVAAMNNAVQQLLSALRCSNHLPLLMLDIEREMLSQSSQTAFEKRLQTMCKAKEDRVRIINEAPISDLEKERLIEETEFNFNDMLVQFMSKNSFGSN